MTRDRVRIGDLMIAVLACAAVFATLPGVEKWPDTQYYTSYATIPIGVVFACLMLRSGSDLVRGKRLGASRIGRLLGAAIAMAVGAKVASIFPVQDALWRLIKPLEDAAYRGDIGWDDALFIGTARAVPILAFGLPQMMLVMIGGRLAARHERMSRHACEPSSTGAASR